MTTRSPQAPLGVMQTAIFLGYEGRGSHTSPSYLTVLKACQRGDLRARQSGGQRKARWKIRPADALTWWSQQ